jgi:hypothetical protein
MSFYNWIRDGVKRAVLLGVSDAIEQIGAPHEEEEISPRLAALLQPGKAPAALATVERPATSRHERKRLGRSLNQIVKTPAGPTAAS